jgi:hypothetical protein
MRFTLPHPLTPSPKMGEGGTRFLLPSPALGEGLGERVKVEGYLIHDP